MEVQELQAASNIESLLKVSNASVKTNPSIEEAIRLIRSDLDALKDRAKGL